jgi:methyl-accepting chemotaxis protein
MQNRKSFNTGMTQAIVSVLVVLCLDIAITIAAMWLRTAGYFTEFAFWNEAIIGVDALVILICIIVIGVQCTKFKKDVVRPIQEITAAIDDLTRGKPARSPAFHSDDEIGLLADSARVLVARMSTDIAFFENLRDGNYAIDLPGASPAYSNENGAIDAKRANDGIAVASARGADGAINLVNAANAVNATRASEAEGGGDKLKYVIQSMIDKQRELVRSLQIVSEQIATASSEIANGSQHLAGGSNEQAAAIEEFSVTVENLKQHAEDNARLANESMESIRKYSAIVKTVGNDMKLMTEKMNDMSESAMRISSVSDIIESIAFQTNILALNAAVEAARAGQHGRGFAVVADEVRELSAKSAAAARETSDLIKSDLENVKTGNQIVEDAASGMANIESIAAENERRMSSLSASSVRQSLSISEISKSINQIAQIVQANSALAEESAASAQELKAQSHDLDAVVNFYTIEEASEKHPEK